MRTEKLKCEHGNQKSYYGKAKVNYLDNGTKELISYKTKVAIITKGGNFIKLWEGYSLTTLIHINEFREQNGLERIRKKDWENLEVKKRGEKLKLVIVDKEGKIKDIYEKEQLDSAISRIQRRSKINLFIWDYEAIKEEFKNFEIGNEYEVGDYTMKVERI